MLTMRSVIELVIVAALLIACLLTFPLTINIILVYAALTVAVIWLACDYRSRP
jgi:hypothetical protein